MPNSLKTNAAEVRRFPPPNGETSAAAGSPPAAGRGLTRDYGGQLFEQVGVDPHTRVDGSRTQLIVWQSACMECGEAFTFRTPIAASKFQPNRRCAKHRRPGSKARRKAKAHV